MRVYTEDEIKKLIKSFKDFLKAKDICLYEYNFPEINGIEVTFTANVKIQDSKDETKTI